MKAAFLSPNRITTQATFKSVANVTVRRCGKATASLTSTSTREFPQSSPAMISDALVAIPESDSTSSDSTTGDFDSPTVRFDEQEVIMKYLYLVEATVVQIKRRVPAHISSDDLHSIGVAGLMSAVRKFNPENERTFAAFARMRIRGAILDELRRSDTCSRRTRARTRELQTAVDAIEQRLGRTATATEICASLGISQADYFQRIEEARPKLVALDAETSDDSSASLHNILADENDETGRDRVEQAELTELLARHIASLPEVPRKILAMYYYENMRFSTIAEVFDLTEARICQIHRSTLCTLRKYLRTARER